MSEGGSSPFQGPPGGRPDDRSPDDPVSWLQIEQGWSVESSDGSPVGVVGQVAGAKGEDIFDGLAVERRGCAPVYVPGEQVGAIYPGRVTLKLSEEQAKALAPYAEAPPQTTIRPGPEPFAERLRRFLGR